MSEWWTYELSDFLMFSPRTWLRLLEMHNSHWSWLRFFSPLPLLLMLWPAGRHAALLLAGMAWVFVAWAFHWQRFADVNWAANYFALAFALQGLLLAVLALSPRRKQAATPDAQARLGWLLIVLALLYPLLALALGRPLAQSESFGLMPDPTALATLGLALCVRGKLLRWLALPIPLLWCAVTGATLWTLHMPEWFLMPLAGMLALALIFLQPASRPTDTSFDTA